jgi:hypothetical protein
VDSKPSVPLSRKLAQLYPKVKSYLLASGGGFWRRIDIRALLLVNE